MIKITGDTHGFYSEFMEMDRNMNAGDICIICGDCGLVYYDNYSERQFLDNLEARSYTIAFVDGNHECFPALYRYPEEVWCGGKIHRIRKNIIHLCRGQVFEIEKRRFFTFGGGFSVDKETRKEGESWWPEELPNDKELSEGIQNLEKYDWTVDYIITHTANMSSIKMLADAFQSIKSAVAEEAPLNLYLEEIKSKTDYKHWFFGHFHCDKVLQSERQTAMYEKYIEIESDERMEKHFMHLCDDAFKSIKNGCKKIELRLYDEKRKHVKVGDEIYFENLETAEALLVKCVELYRADSFYELFNILKNPCAMGFCEGETSTSMAQKMREYYSETEEREYGVLGIGIELIQL